MKIKSIHTRELPVAPEEVGALFDGLGSPGDRLWPTDRWPTARPLAEDLLDRAVLATTGRIADPARWPISVRIANALELAIARWRGILPPPRRATPDRLARFSGIAVPGVLIALAALHVSWALGSYWPADSESELAEYVLSGSERDLLDGGLPPAALTWAVALSLASGAAIVRAAATVARSRGLRAAAGGVAAVFFVPAVPTSPRT